MHVQETFKIIILIFVVKHTFIGLYEEVVYMWTDILSRERRAEEHKRVISINEAYPNLYYVTNGSTNYECGSGISNS